MARHSVPLNEALQALKNEAARGAVKTASVVTHNDEESIPQLLRKTAEFIRTNETRDVTYAELYRVKEAFYARR